MIEKRRSHRSSREKLSEELEVLNVDERELKERIAESVVSLLKGMV